MATHQDEDLKMALRLSMQQEESPEPKENSSDQPPPPEESSEESPEVKNRRIQRDLMAAAAEKRMKSVESVKDVQIRASDDESKGKGVGSEEVEAKSGISGMELSVVEANKLFLMIFGEGVSKNVLAQWCNQGIRFSVDHETSIGLVQHEGGPCGVLSAIQGFILKYLLFSPEESCSVVQKKLPCLAMRRVFNDVPVASDNFSSLSEDTKLRALVRSMSEILFQCGSNKAAVIVSLNILDLVDSTKGTEDEAIAKALGCLSVESGSDFQKVLRVNTFTSQSGAIQKLEALLPIFRSRLGALLFLISALLSRGLDAVQEDRDDPTQPLVTAPFGHASQEIVNLLLSGSAVSNVFDENIDLGGGMFVKGISTTVEVGFLTLLESLNYCKVGQYLKCPHWPIWVVGSESHYTVLFALDTKVQEENELENREIEIRRAFDGQDQSGGGGFISVEGFHQVLKETSINLPQEKVQHLCSTEFIVWSEFWQVIMDLDKSLGGLKDISGAVGSMVFDLYHYNGIAKSFTTSNQESFGQRPRLTKLRVTVPPAVEYLPAGPVPKEVGSSSEGGFKAAQHAPLVDCIRTRWARSMCNWEGDSPSIV